MQHPQTLRLILSNMIANNLLCYSYTSLTFIYSDLGVYFLAILWRRWTSISSPFFIVLYVIPVDAFKLTPSDLALYSD